MDDDLESQYEEYENNRRLRAIENSIQGSLLNDDNDRPPNKCIFIIIICITLFISIGLAVFIVAKYSN